MTNILNRIHLPLNAFSCFSILLLIILSQYFSVYEIQRKYVEHDFVVSKPFVYFVMDIHTKVSLIAGVITDPLASPIWI